MSSKQDAIRRVRALRRTAAAGSGATEPERDTANRLAARLTARHALTEADLTEQRRIPPVPPRATYQQSYRPKRKPRPNVRADFNLFEFAIRYVDTTLGIVLDPDDVSFGVPYEPDEPGYP